MHAPATYEDGCEAMTNLLDEILEARGVLPGSLNATKSTTLAHAPIAALLGQPDANEAYLYGRWAMRRFPDATLDLEGGDPCPVQMTRFPSVMSHGETTWAPRLLNTRTELKWWASALVYYAMYYLAATCGLRDKDIDHLPLDCLSIEQTTIDGVTVETYKIRGYQQKNRRAPVPAEWLVGARVARVVQVVQRLIEVYGWESTTHEHTGDRRLFDGRLITASARETRGTVHLDNGYIKWLKAGARTLHERGVVPQSLDTIGSVTVQQVRITAAQAYAKRPLGEALAAHFGKWDRRSVALGYHGDVHKVLHLADPSDASEATHEATGASIQHAASNMDDYQGRGKRRLTEVVMKEASALANGAPLSPARLKALGKRHPNIRTGPHTLCVYNAETALCGGHGAADFRLCRPFECAGSAMNRAQRARMELERRSRLEMSPALRRGAEKISEGMPSIVTEFKDMSSDQLAALVKADFDSEVLRALGEDRVDPPSR